MNQEKDASLETLQDIRSIMERSARFLSLSGWSGIWAGCVALIGAAIAFSWMHEIRDINKNITDGELLAPDVVKFFVLGLLIFVCALAGGLFFTLRKARQEGHSAWNNASRQMLIQLIIPMVAGAVFVLGFLKHGNGMYIAPSCLVFYGLALINGSKYTLADIRYLGLCEVGLGCISIFIPGYGLVLWSIGFGILHILYGIIMWNKYDKKTA